MAAKAQPENVSVERHALERHVETGNFLTTLFMLDVAGKKQRVIPRAVQVDPVSDRPVHVDFMRLDAGRESEARHSGALQEPGESPGLKKGGVLNIIRHEVEMLCPADNIPDFDRSRSGRSGHPRHRPHLQHQAAGRREAAHP